MNIETLAQDANEIISDMPYSMRCDHGIEVAPGFFNLYNTMTGQSKPVLYHPESGLVFKQYFGSIKPNASKRYLGEFTMYRKTFRVRLPEFHVIEVNDTCSIHAQEYVAGEICACGHAWCEHSRGLRDVTKCFDTHSGNWKIVGDEIVLFDFEGINLDKNVVE